MKQPTHHATQFNRVVSAVCHKLNLTPPQVLPRNTGRGETKAYARFISAYILHVVHRWPFSRIDRAFHRKGLACHAVGRIRGLHVCDKYRVIAEGLVHRFIPESEDPSHPENNP
jgi:hypothetical protein